MEIPVDRP